VRLDTEAELFNDLQNNSFIN